MKLVFHEQNPSEIINMEIFTYLGCILIFVKICLYIIVLQIMRVIALNSSPKGKKSKTALILNPFIEGLEEGGAQVELFYIKDLTINPCQGDFSCYFSTPGICYQTDDMKDLLDKFIEAELWIFASPVYVDGINGPMKTLMDRMIPLMKPEYEIVNNHCRHPLRNEVNDGMIALVSNCGFWGLDNFDSLLTHIKAFSENFKRRFVGALLRPHGPILKGRTEIFDAARKAGYQLATEGEISKKTLDEISQEIVTREKFVNEINVRTRKIIE